MTAKALTLTEKILHEHLVTGEMKKGAPIGIRIDQTLTQDATGTMAYLQLEAMGVDQVKTELSVSYVDHNTLQSGFENADDHKYLQTVAKKHGVFFSRPGNGICHQVHLERFGRPGATLLGSDSHTPTGGGIGMLAIGAGGLDVACAMAGEPFMLNMPRVVEVRLTGALQKGVSAKDVILKVLSMLTVKGGVGKVIEYTGDGVKTLSVPERATITNMGAELGATTSVFPSDEVTRDFLRREGREDVFRALAADAGAVYDERYDIDLAALEPLIALPHMPDVVKTVREVAGQPIDQVAIGSCTNSSYRDIMTVASILDGKRVAPNVSLVLSPGSRQVLSMVAEAGGLAKILAAGARLLECTCGPCIGMGQSPVTNAWSLRTFNRNFKGRSGTLSANVCLVSPETAAASAIRGVITDPREADFDLPAEPQAFLVDDSMIYAPEREHPESVEVVQGPNIRPLPENTPLAAAIEKEVVIKVGDNITTDHIMPAGAKVLPYRSNIEKISEFVFRDVQEGFKAHCQKAGGGIIVAGENYGQGSSREHAALAPMYLGIKAVLAKSFARIHAANLVNFGIVPLLFDEAADYESIAEGDVLFFDFSALAPDAPVRVENRTKKRSFSTHHALSALDIEMLKAGGKLNYIKNKQQS
ncbi:aconitate hydratase [Selenomonas sputigena ATCC 35185]|uniref:Aconitate hydratase n=2 Tax=Selenomonas sputigena (strain ATCC 35185 / DSM 20758 / CCUG 44933 / VPI D19B-28) TaxID=546271 RepID=F4EWF4_SELS3|nr:aconitate hydratase [Selenomonas sputigena ATCC 35185]